jgi:hypothetical protein
MQPRATSSPNTQLTGKRRYRVRRWRRADTRTRLKLVLPRALLTTGDGPKMAPGWVLTTSWPAAARAMASSKAAILVMVYGSELGSLVTGASSRSRPPDVSKNVPVLTATTRRMPTRSAASRTYLVPLVFTAVKSARS